MPVLLRVSIQILSLLLAPSSHALNVNNAAVLVNRRAVLQQVAVGGGLVAVPLLVAPQAEAAVALAAVTDDDGDDSTTTVPRQASVLVLGAGGKTGLECVAALLATNRPCIATTRTGRFDAFPENDRLATAIVDVSSRASIEEAIASSSSSSPSGKINIGAVIFAASTGSSGRDPFPVDRDGAVNAAKCCIAAGIPRLVLVSSGTVTRPDTAVYKLLNAVGHGIMEAKIQGEDAVRELYADPLVKTRKLGYTVIRPGGLTSGESLGPSFLELNQGDSKSGRLSRADVAALCIQCLDSPDAFDATFECYETSTAKPLESVGLSNILNSNKPTEFTSGFERRGDTWPALFAGLTRDAGGLNAMASTL